MRHSRSFKKRNISLENNNDKKRDFKFNEDYLIELSLLSSALISTYLFIISDIIFLIVFQYISCCFSWNMVRRKKELAPEKRDSPGSWEIPGG